MSQEPRQLQAQFDPDEIDVEVSEGFAFEKGKLYTFVLEQPSRGKYIQYGPQSPKTMVIDGVTYPLAGSYSLSKKVPKELLKQYLSHPDQFEIFTNGDVNGQQALIPGKDFAQFKPFLSGTVDMAWVHESEEGGKRLVYMSLSADRVSISEKHPGDRGFESPAVILARKLGVDIGLKKQFSWSFLHPGVAIEAEVEMVQRKGDTRERPQIVFDSIQKADNESGSGSGSPSQSKVADDIDPEIKMTVLELADGCTSVVAVIKKVKEHLKNENLEKAEMAELLGKYSDAINKLKNSGEILK